MVEIGKLLDKVESNEIVLPEFQREFVWKKSQAKELIKSLYLGYPIGSLLIWETENPPEIKNDAVNEKDFGLFKVLLDGQQRLTVLYLMMKNDIPPYYKKYEIKHDPRNLYFNLPNDTFQYENKSIRTSKEWVKVTDVFEEKIDVFNLVKEIYDEENEDSFDIANEYNRKLNQLKRIKNLSIPTLELPKSADIHQAIDLFDKVNSQGTELGDAELTLSHMSAHWPHVRRKLKKLMFNMKKEGFDFSLDFYVKCMIALTTDSITYEKAYDIEASILKEKYSRLKDVLKYITNYLKNEVNIADSSYISTKAVLVPLVYFVEKNDIKLNFEQKRNFQRWIYAALMWSRYGSSTDSKLERDLSLLRINDDNPTKELMEEIKDERGRIELQAADLDGRGKRSKRFYNMVRVLMRSNKPVDWISGEQLIGSYELESHHIFPKSVLYNKKYNPKNHMDRKRVNEIANRAFITPNSNKEIFTDLPEEYLPNVQKDHPFALKKQLIPENEELWKLENYEDFLVKRRKKIAEKINEFMDSLITTDIDEDDDLEKLIEMGENYRIEFKETLFYDIYRKQANKELKDEIAKEVASFANSKGGTLLIGIKDENKEIKGLERDFKIMRKGKDDFELMLNQALINKLGDKFTSIYAELNFEKINEKEIAVLSVESSPEPIYYGNEKDFYVRIGSSSRALDTQEATKYISDHWK